MFIAIVGADGSGKSTLVKDLVKWLSWKIEIRKVYFGIPKNISLKYYSRLIELLYQLLKRIPDSIIKKKGVCIVDMLNAYKWIWIARKRHQIYRKALAWTAKGLIVISDRYPIREFRHMARPMDGPRIRKELETKGQNWADFEQNYYSQIGLPDKVFVLKTDINELRKRKKDLDISTHLMKADAVNSIRESTDICLINANRPYREVLQELKCRIWELLYCYM